MKQSDQLNFDDLTAASQAQFEAMLQPGELKNQIETDYNEIHAMYPFLPVDPPVIRSILTNVNGGASTVYSYDIPSAAKLMRISTNTSNPRFWGFTYQAAINDNDKGDGWHIVPANNQTNWIYCGHMQQVHITGQTGFGRVNIEFASVHQRIG